MNKKQRAKPTDALDENAVSEAEAKLGLTARELTDIYVLLSVKGIGPQKFKEMHKRGVEAGKVIAQSSALPIPGKTGDALRKAISQIGETTKKDCFERAQKQLLAALKNHSTILTYRSTAYPKILFDSNYPVPILYCKGNTQVLQNDKSVACVGSRGIREPYATLQKHFAKHAAVKGYNIVSGFALGADTIGHRAAVESGGATIGVMPSGLDRPFPPENKDFWATVTNYSKGLFVSEFPFGTGANSLNLKKRNKMIVAFAQAVLVAQSAEKGGAMNAYRFAREQKKPVATFAPDGRDDTSGNRLIQNEKRDGDSVFALVPEPDAYSQWLSRLSFLI
jgi:DNA processing protein